MLHHVLKIKRGKNYTNKLTKVKKAMIIRNPISKSSRKTRMVNWMNNSQTDGHLTTLISNSNINFMLLYMQLAVLPHEGLLTYQWIITGINHITDEKVDKLKMKIRHSLEIFRVPTNKTENRSKSKQLTEFRMTKHQTRQIKLVKILLELTGLESKLIPNKH